MLLVLTVADAEFGKRGRGGMKNCPYCAEEIQEAAIKCKHCGTDLFGASLAVQGAAATGVALVTPAEQRTSTQTMAQQQLGPAVLVILGGLLVALGSFLPWVTASAPFVGSISRSGMDGGDGVITLVLGAAAAVLGLMVVAGVRPSKAAPILVILCAVGAAAIAGLDYSDVQGRVQTVEAASSMVSASVGAGLWSIFVGAVMTGMGGGGLALRSAKSSKMEKGMSR